MARETSARISQVLNRCLDQAPSLEKELLSSLGKDDAKISNEGHLIIDWIRNAICKEITSLIGKEAVDGEPINDGKYSSSIRGHLFYPRAAAVNDPAAAVARWIFEGAPAGISEDFEALRRTFPPSALVTWRQYHTLTLKDSSTKEASRRSQKPTTPSWAIATAASRRSSTRSRVAGVTCGSDPVLSKFGCVVQERRNHITGKVKIKRRVILDTKQSKVKFGTNCGYRSVLPRVSDAIFGALEQMHEAQEEELIEWLIADFKDTFWLIPL